MCKRELKKRQRLPKKIDNKGRPNLAKPMDEQGTGFSVYKVDERGKFAAGMEVRSGTQRNMTTVAHP